MVRTRRKKILRWIVTVAALAAITVAGFAVNEILIQRETDALNKSLEPTPPDYERQIEQLRSADVAREVETAWATGDHRFVSVLGKNVLVPGVPEERYPNNPPSDCRVIRNTTDALESEVHGRLQGVAYDYALRYNTLLLQKLEEEEGKLRSRDMGGE